MARSKKKAISQQVVNVATTGMPSPIRKFLGSRIIALLIVLTLPVLFATGVVSIKWENGRPRLSLDRQRAAEVKHRTAEKIQDLRAEEGQEERGLLRVLPHGEGANPSNFSVDSRPEEQFGHRVAERVEEVRDRFDAHNKQGLSLLPTSGEPANQGKPATGPLPRLKQLFKR